LASQVWRCPADGCVRRSRIRHAGRPEYGGTAPRRTVILGAAQMESAGRPAGSGRTGSCRGGDIADGAAAGGIWAAPVVGEMAGRSEEHTSELQSRENLVC